MVIGLPVIGTVETLLALAVSITCRRDTPAWGLSLLTYTHRPLALETIRDGGKVYAHCAGGRHRGVTMGAAILIAQGYDPLSAMTLIKEKRPIADPFIFYIRPRILKFASQWNGE